MANLETSMANQQKRGKSAKRNRHVHYCYWVHALLVSKTRCLVDILSSFHIPLKAYAIDMQIFLLETKLGCSFSDPVRQFFSSVGGKGRSSGTLSISISKIVIFTA